MYFIDYTITVVPFFSPLFPSALYTRPPPAFPHLSSCPWVVHKSSLAFPFLILFLTLPGLFVSTIYASYSLYLFLLSPSAPSSRVCGTVVLLFCSCSSYLLSSFLGSVLDSCEFAVISLFIVLIIFFFLDKFPLTFYIIRAW